MDKNADADVVNVVNGSICTHLYSSVLTVYLLWFGMNVMRKGTDVAPNIIARGGKLAVSSDRPI